MKEQFRRWGVGYDWRREVNTSAVDYYKWTQWIFLVLYERGLAYQKKAPVNWCPSCQTGLANEEVVDGKCDRCGAEVAKRDIPQWFFKITEYAQRLLDDLEELEGKWPETVRTMQANWIGRSEGARVDFKDRSPKDYGGQAPAAGLHDAAGHALGRDVHEPCRRASDHPEAGGRDAAREGGPGVLRAVPPAVGGRPRRRGGREGGRLHGRVLHQPRERREGAALGGQLRPHGIRHRGGDGRARARPARFRVREEVRPAPSRS